MFDIALPLLRFTLLGFNLLPLSLRLRSVEGLIRAYAWFDPKVRKVSLRNLSLVYPSASPQDLDQKLSDSYRALARFIVDSARFHTLDETWAREHIETPFAEGFRELKKRNPGKGILIAAGHLGSIELQGLAGGALERKLSFVARNLKHASIDTWWKKNRERYGNRMIDRKGAVQKMLSNLRKGVDVAILIDQNVRREHAIFVDWFGRPAATTFAFGKAAVETQAPVVISSITHLGDDKYRLNEYAMDLSDIYENSALSNQEKVLEVTRRVSAEYQKVILAQPSEWFWLHRRWKTTPEGVEEDFYR